MTIVNQKKKGGRGIDKSGSVKHTILQETGEMDR